MSHTTTTRAIILKRVPYGEADWIVTLFTREHGRIAGMAKSARKSVRRYGSGLEPGALALVTFSTRMFGSLANLTAAEVVFSTTGMMKSLARIEALAHALRLGLSFLRDHQAVPEKFDLMEAYLARLAAADPTPSSRLGFALKWLALSGFEPLIGACASCGVEQGDGDAVFSSEQGGVVCPDCARGIRSTVALPAGARSAMAAMIEGPLDADVGVDDIAPAAMLVDRYIEHVLGGPLARG